MNLFEKSHIFGGSSFLNQNRLHNGFHYSRSKKTRDLCRNTFSLFTLDYPDIVIDVPNNYYAIPNNRSILDFETFKGIFEHENVPFRQSDLEVLTDIEGSIVVDEKHIDPIKAKHYFKHRLADILIEQELNESELDKLTKQYDIVVNVTNNALKPLSNHYYELSLTLLYTRKIEKGFGAITMVDGPLFSIYPYNEDDYTVTDVEYTPLYTCDALQDLVRYKTSLTHNNVDQIKQKIEQKIKHYYNDFNNHFIYKGYYTSMKVKNSSQSADRSPIIVQEDNLITCVTGKIQGIYTLENYIQDEIASR